MDIAVDVYRTGEVFFGRRHFNARLTQYKQSFFVN